jgi:hypothetical protein
MEQTRDSEVEQEIADVAPELIIHVGRFTVGYFLAHMDSERVHRLLHCNDRRVALDPCYHSAVSLRPFDAIQFIQGRLRGCLAHRDDETIAIASAADVCSPGSNESCELSGLDL